MKTLPKLPTPPKKPKEPSITIPRKVVVFEERCRYDNTIKLSDLDLPDGSEYKDVEIHIEIDNDYDYDELYVQVSTSIPVDNINYKTELEQYNILNEQYKKALSHYNEAMAKYKKAELENSLEAAKDRVTLLTSQLNNLNEENNDN